MFDTIVICFGVVVISLFEGPVKVTVDFDPLVTYEDIVRPTYESLIDTIPQIFSFSLTWYLKE